MTREQIHIGDMSHETAIGILKLMLEAMETYDGISPTPERVNAMKMAIKALEQESVIDKIRAEIKALTSNRGFLSCSVEYIHEKIDNVFDKYKADRSEDNGNNN